MHYCIADPNGGHHYDAAIYAIVSLKTGLIYVGSSRFVETRRKQHMAGITNGTHKQAVVRQAFAGHATDDVEFRVLERFEIPANPETMFIDFDAAPMVSVMLDREREWARKLGAINAKREKQSA